MNQIDYRSVFLLFSFLWPLSSLQGQTRNEISRFTLLNDRAFVERSLRNGPHNSEKMQFVSLQLALSSGLKGLIGDTKDATRSSLSTVQKETEVLKLINKNINSERFVEGHLAVAAPLPMIKHRSFRLLPSLFSGLNLGSSFSFSAQTDPLNPQAQVYLKTDQKLGLYTRFFWDKKREYEVSFYQLSRSDLYSTRSSQQIIEQEALLDFDDEMKEEKSLMLDFRYHQKHQHQSYVFEIQELKIKTSESSEGDSLFRSKPLLHFQYWRYWQASRIHWQAVLGQHYRQRYTILDGLYLGLEADFKDVLPLTASAQISNQFFSLSPSLKVKFIQLYYQLSSPYRNPQDEMWVSTIHKLGLIIPFP